MEREYYPQRQQREIYDLSKHIEAMKQEQEEVQRLLEHERKLEARNQEPERRLEEEGYKRQQPWWRKALRYLLTRNNPR